MNTISVLVVDDNPVMTHCMTRFLQVDSQVTVLGVVSSIQEVLDKARELRPDVILIDPFVPGMSGLQIISHLRAELPQVGIVAMAMHETSGYRQALLAAGADDFVPKPSAHHHLLPAIWRTRKPALQMQ